MNNSISNHRIKLVKGDLLNQKVDAIVNPTNQHLSGKGIASSIRKAGGKQLEKYCLKLIPLNVGEAKITPGYNLPILFIIHTHEPLWIDNISGEKEEEFLAKCYRNSLALVNQYQIKSVAFPGISTGFHGFPFDKAAKIAVNEVTYFLQKNSSTQKVIFVCWKQEEYNSYQKYLEYQYDKKTRI